MPQWRRLAPGQRARLWTFDVVSGDRRLVHESSDGLFEAPNWTPDGRWLIVNQDGLLHRVPAGGGAPEPVDTATVRDVNNDHVVAPDGRSVFVSSAGGHLYRIALDGGAVRRVSNDHPEPFVHFLHGVSPDGRLLAYVGARPGPDGSFASLDIYTVPVDGGEDRRLSTWDRPDDGPEFSPDGAWIYFNSEMASVRPGHAQLFRMRPDGGGVEQLSDDERVNWFPHLSPDGSRLVYLSFPPGVVGHPADHDVLLRAMDPDGGPPEDLLALRGGQGTLNVNSWAPDSRRFAYVDYPG